MHCASKKEDAKLLYRSSTHTYLLRATPHMAMPAAEGRGFLQSRSAKASSFGVTVNLKPAEDPDPALQSLLERVEDKRAISEKAMFDQVFERCALLARCQS